MKHNLFGTRDRNAVETVTKMEQRKYIERVQREAVKDTLFASAKAAPRASGGVPSMLTRSERQFARAAEAELAQKAATALPPRTLVVKSGAVTKSVTLGTLPANLSDGAFRALNFILAKYTEAEKKPVKIITATLAGAMEVGVAKAQAALDELRKFNLLVDVTDSFGVKKVIPSPLVVHDVIEAGNS